MICDGLGLDAAELRLVVEWLEINPQDEAVPLEAAQAAALKAHGGDRRSEEFQLGVTKLKLSSDGGMTATYVVDRLERHGHHELAAQVRAGQISANAAAIQAGFRRRPSKFDLAMRWLPEFTERERRQLKQALEGAQ